MSQIKGLASVVSGEDSLPGLRTATFVLCLPGSFWCVYVERQRERASERALSLVFRLRRTLMRSDQGPVFMTSVNCLLKAPSPDTVTLDVRVSAYLGVPSSP